MDTSLFTGNLVESQRILYTPSAFAKTNPVSYTHLFASFSFISNLLSLLRRDFM